MSKTNNDNLKPDLFELDKNRLDEEWLAQSRLVYAAGMRAAECRESCERAKVARDVAEDDLKKVDADLRLKIIRDPSSFGLEKTTEAVLDAAILLQPKHEQAKQILYEAEAKVIKKKFALDLADTECRALDPNRLKQLENLTSLDSRSYWDRVKVEHGPKDQQTNERMMKELAKKSQRRKSKKH